MTKTYKPFNEIGKIQKSIQKFHITRNMDVRKNTIYSKSNHLYGSYFNSENQLNHLHDIIFYGLELLNKIYPESNYVPHSYYMRKPKEEFVIIDSREVCDILEGLLYCIQENKITYEEKVIGLSYKLERVKEKCNTFREKNNLSIEPLFQKPEIDRDVLKEVQNVSKSIQQYYGYLELRKDIKSIDEYSEVMNETFEKELLNEIVFQTLILLDNLYKDVDLNFVPHLEFMRLPIYALTDSEVLSLSALLGGLLKFVDKNELVAKDEEANQYIERAKSLKAKISSHRYMIEINEKYRKSK